METGPEWKPQDRLPMPGAGRRVAFQPACDKNTTSAASFLFVASVTRTWPLLPEVSLFPICRRRSALRRRCTNVAFCLRERCLCLPSLRLPRPHTSVSSPSHTFQLGPPSAAAAAPEQYGFPDIRRVGRPELKLVLGNLTHPNPFTGVCWWMCALLAAIHR